MRYILFIVYRKYRDFGCLTPNYFIDVMAKSFTFIDDDNKRYKGKLDETVDVDGFVAPVRAKVTIEEAVAIHSFSTDKTVSYKLKNIDQRNDLEGLKSKL